ncbi:uncharacterized protein [Anser cygnoides]|uniref:uncharacterized protein isoform X2 n=1 Tax=Anser cygnoides TaxID=8845 RepID=UPI0034D17CE0
MPRVCHAQPPPAGASICSETALPRQSRGRARSPLLAWGRRRGPRCAGTTQGSGRPQLCSPRTPFLLAAGRGDPLYGAPEDEGDYLYLDEDGPLEVLGGPARCQDSYQDWVALYCWAPFHAALMAAPEGSRCRWEQIGSAYSELSACTELLAQLFSCPWPSTALDAFFLQVHAEYFSNCSRMEPPGSGGLPPGLAAAAAVALGCLVPLAAAFTVRRAWRGARSPAGSGTAPSVPVATLG